jgi:hypothetical protein
MLLEEAVLYLVAAMLGGALMLPCLSRMLEEAVLYLVAAMLGGGSYVALAIKEAGGGCAIPGCCCAGALMLSCLPMRLDEAVLYLVAAVLGL